MLYSNAKLLEIVTADKLKLPGILFEPKNKTKKALIYLHGNGSASVFYSLNELALQAQKFNKVGFSYFVFNNRGSGYVSKIKKTRGSKVERVLAGTAYELIKDCIKDIDAAIAMLKKYGYKELYLIGFSTGANKICVYNFYKPKNDIKGYILVAGGDDLGSYYRMLGRKKFIKLLKLAKQKSQNRKGMELVPRSLLNETYSYQSTYDIMNPDGDYNAFPYNEYFHDLKLSKKQLFRHYQSITKPTLVIYGDKDEYTYGKVSEIIDVLKEKSLVPDKFRFAVIKGADHNFTGKQAILGEIIKNWLKV